MFTLNNPTIEPNQDECTYLVYGREVGENGTPHLQGFSIFKKTKRLSGCKKWLPGAHFELAKGTNDEASDYCKKDGDFTEIGDLPADTSEAKKRQWEQVVQWAREGTIETNDPEVYVKYNRFCERERAKHRKLERLESTCGYWIYGPSGTGKTTAVMDLLGQETIYDKGVNKWWDGYDDEENVLIDDVTAENGKFIASNLLRWADKFPVRVETKGGGLKVRPKRIIVTSNYSIDDVFNNCGVDMDALKRRFKCIYKENIEYTIEI